MPSREDILVAGGAAVGGGCLIVGLWLRGEELW